jgi:hypothetical protein
MNDNLRLLTGNGVKDHNRELRDGLAQIIEAQSLIAQITRGKYNALIAQGFTASQALELCK